jgi:hypothetical protein
LVGLFWHQYDCITLSASSLFGSIFLCLKKLVWK